METLLNGRTPAVRSLPVLAAAFVASGAWGAAALPPKANYPLVSHPVLQSYSENFEVDPPADISLKPSCLRANGLDLIILDAGHNDSAEAQRSQARGCSGCAYENRRPLIHEGKLNQAVVWMIYDMMLKDATLSSSERAELKTMIRFTRLPGETAFGQYEMRTGYNDHTNGAIAVDSTNRVAHVNEMMARHRVNGGNARSDVTSRTLLQMIHANSSEIYDAADYLWIMRPASITNDALSYMQTLARAFQEQMSGYFDARVADSDAVKSLKNAVRGTYHPSRTLLEHFEASAMLSTRVGNARTIRAIAEGFFMDGKVGNLVNRELTTTGHDKYLRFERDGSVIARYIVSDAYERYAKSVVKGIGERFGCR